MLSTHYPWERHRIRFDWLFLIKHVIIFKQYLGAHRIIGRGTEQILEAASSGTMTK